MGRKIKKMFCMLLCFAIFSAQASIWAEEIKLQVGEDAYAVYQDGVVIISGTGTMWDSEWVRNGDEIMESDSPFCNNSIGPITTIHVEEGITGIGAYNFTMCSVAEVYLPTTLCTIGKYAFGDCSELTSIIQSGTQLAIISEGVFFKCSALRYFPFDEYEMLETIENRAFAYSGLEEIFIPPNITYIGDSAFFLCANLTSLEIADGGNALTIESAVFETCRRLKTAILPDRASRLGNMLFCQDDTLKEVRLPESLKEIPPYMFNDCPSLHNIELPFDLEVIGERAFAECENLAPVKLPNTVKTIGNAAFSSSLHWPIIIPESVISIGAGALHPPYWYGANDFPIYFIGSESAIEIGNSNPHNRIFNWSPIAITENWGNGTEPNINLLADITNELVEIKYASGHQIKSYFESNGTLVNSDTLQLDNGLYTFFSKDEMGNETTMQYEVTMVDRLAPQLNISINGSKITIDVNDS